MRWEVKTWTPLIVMGFAALMVSVGVLTWERAGPQMLINQTRSEPLGIYQLVVHPKSDYRRGMLVLFPVPENVRALVYGRHWLPKDVPLMKELWGLAGDRVCVLADRLEVNGRTVGPMFERDREGQLLPRIRGCFLVQSGSIFPASNHVPNSFDGRYFGTVPLSQVLGEARPIWTF